MKPCKLCQSDMKEGQFDYCEKCRKEWKRPRERFYYLKKRQSDESRKISSERSQKWNEEHYERFRNSQDVKKKQQRTEALSFYSNSNIPQCVCCGETNINVLALDHINNDAKQDNTNRGGQAGVFRRALKLKDKTLYQTLCYNCNWKKHIANLKDNRKNHKENIHGRKMKQNRKIKCIAHYSNNTNKCCNCGNNDMEVMCLDHINNDGNIHRKGLNNGKNAVTGSGMYGWAIKNNFPPIFQVLCFNCNILKHRQKGTL